MKPWHGTATRHDGDAHDQDQRAERRALLDKLARIPDSERRFTVTEAEARNGFQVPAEVLGRLRSEGLPATSVAGEWVFDPIDLLNVALHLDVGSKHRKVLAWWAREVERPYGDRVTYRLDYRVGCPSPGHSGDCHYSLLVPHATRTEVSRSSQEVTLLGSATFRLPRRWPAPPPELVALVDELADMQFVRLPWSLRGNTDFIRSSGIGDCFGMSKLMVAEGNARGMPARICYGRSLTPPFSAGHFWAEFLVDGLWLSMDPILIDALLGWGFLDPSRWTRYDSLGGILGRLADDFQPLVIHNGEVVESLLPCYRIG